MKHYVDFNIQNNDEKFSKNNVEAKYKDNELSFKYDNESIKISINKDNIIMQKENNESLLVFNFTENKKTDCEYFIKELNFYIDTKVLTNKLSIDENNIYIEYELWLQDEYSGKFTYVINIKEM